MASYLLLGLLLLTGIPTGKSQNLRECRNCNVYLFSQCFFTESYGTQCADESSQCGTVNFAIGTQHFFSRMGCLQTGDCNKTTTQLTGVLRMLNYNSTCCTANYCNSGFSIQAPRLTFLGALATVTLAVIS